MGVNTTLLEGARKALLHAEDCLEEAGYQALAFEIGLKADQVAEYISELQDDGGMTHD